MSKNLHSFGVSPYPVSPAWSYDSIPDVLSEPDDSYPIREPKKGRKQKSTDTSGNIETFFDKPLAPETDSEDIVMNEGEIATANEETSV